MLNHTLSTSETPCTRSMKVQEPPRKRAKRSKTEPTKAVQQSQKMQHHALVSSRGRFCGGLTSLLVRGKKTGGGRKYYINTQQDTKLSLLAIAPPVAAAKSTRHHSAQAPQYPPAGDTPAEAIRAQSRHSPRQRSRPQPPPARW